MLAKSRHIVGAQVNVATVVLTDELTVPVEPSLSQVLPPSCPVSVPISVPSLLPKPLKSSLPEDDLPDLPHLTLCWQPHEDGE